MSNEFFEQYKHPEWQRKRLEALDAAEYTCQRCGATESQLHVHHKRYVKGRKVWQYDVAELAVLCDECHEQEHVGIDLLRDVTALIPPGMVEYAALVLAGWVEYVAGLQIDCARISDPDHYVAGKLAGYASSELAPWHTEKLAGIRPDVVAAFIDRERP